MLPNEQQEELAGVAGENPSVSSDRPIMNVAAQKGTIKAARVAKTTLKVAGGGLVFAFGFLKFHGLDFAPLVHDLSAQLLLRGTLAIYLFCWVAGLTWDIDDQELIYAAPPDIRRVTTMCVGAFIGLAIPFGVLCYVQSYRAFAVVLSAFLLFNVVCWLGLIKFVLPDPVAKTAEYYVGEKADVELMELRLFANRYLKGRWQRRRFCAGAVIVALIDAVAFTGLYERVDVLRQVGSKDFVLAILVLVFVLVMEIWIWLERGRFKASRSLLECVANCYSLHPLAKNVQLKDSDELCN